MEKKESVRKHSESEMQYRKENVLKSVESLFVSFDIGFISDHLSELCYNAVKSKESDEFTKEKVISLFSNSMELLSRLSEMYVGFSDYYECKKEQ